MSVQLKVSSVAAMAERASIMVCSTTPFSSPVTVTCRLSRQNAVKSALFNVKGLLWLKIASPPVGLNATFGGLTVRGVAPLGPKKEVKAAVFKTLQLVQFSP